MTNEEKKKKKNGVVATTTSDVELSDFGGFEARSPQTTHLSHDRGHLHRRKTNKGNEKSREGSLSSLWKRRRLVNVDVELDFIFYRELTIAPSILFEASFFLSSRVPAKNTNQMPAPQSDSIYVPRSKARSSTLSAKSQYAADKERRTQKIAKVDGRRIYGDARGWRAREKTVRL